MSEPLQDGPLAALHAQVQRDQDAHMESMRRAAHLIERNLRHHRRHWIIMLSGFLEPLVYLLGIGYGVVGLLAAVAVTLVLYRPAPPPADPEPVAQENWPELTTQQIVAKTEKAVALIRSGTATAQPSAPSFSIPREADPTAHAAAGKLPTSISLCKASAITLCYDMRNP